MTASNEFADLKSRLLVHRVDSLIDLAYARGIEIPGLGVTYAEIAESSNLTVQEKETLFQLVYDHLHMLLYAPPSRK